MTERSTTWLNNQNISFKMYEEFCDMKGMYPYGGEQRCPFCKTKRRFVAKKQGDYSFAIMCRKCSRVISPLNDSVFAHTKIHLSVWLKAMYILKVRQPDILLKHLATALNVSLVTVRSMKRKILALRKNSFELRFLKRLEPLIEENYTFIFNENPKQKTEKEKLALSK